MLSYHLFWTSGWWTYHPGITQEEGHAGLLHLPSAVLALIFVARRIQPSLSLVDRESNLCLLMIQSFSTCWSFFLMFLPLFFCKEKSQLFMLRQHRDSNSRPNVRRFRGNQLNHRCDRLWDQSEFKPGELQRKILLTPGITHFSKGSTILVTKL